MHKFEERFQQLVEDLMDEARREMLKICRDFDYETARTRMSFEKFLKTRLGDLRELIQPEDSISNKSSVTAESKTPSKVRLPKEKWTLHEIPFIDPIPSCDESQREMFLLAIASVLAGREYMRKLREAIIYFLAKFPDSKMVLDEKIHFQPVVNRMINGIFEALDIPWTSCAKSFPVDDLKVESWKELVRPGGIPDAVLLDVRGCPRQFVAEQAIGVVEVKMTPEMADFASRNQTMVYHAACLDARGSKQSGIPCFAITTDVTVWHFSIADAFRPHQKFAVAMAETTSATDISSIIWGFYELYKFRKQHERTRTSTQKLFSTLEPVSENLFLK
jgi:hypothetical protein